MLAAGDHHTITYDLESVSRIVTPAVKSSAFRFKRSRSKCREKADVSVQVDNGWLKLEEEVAALRSMTMNLDSENIALKKALEFSVEEDKRKTETITNLTADLEMKTEEKKMRTIMFKKKTEETELQLNEVRKKLSDMQENIKLIEKQRNDFKFKASSTTNKLLSLQNELKERDVTITRQSDSIRDLESKLIAIDEEATTRNLKLSENKREIAEWKEKAESWKKQSQEVRRELSLRKEEFEDFESRMREQRKRVEDLTLNQSKLELERNGLQNEVSQLRDDLNNELNVFEDKLGETKQYVDRLESECAKQKYQLTARTLETDRLRDIGAEHEQELTRFYEALQQQKQKRKEVERNLVLTKRKNKEILSRCLQQLNILNDQKKEFVQHVAKDKKKLPAKLTELLMTTMDCLALDKERNHLVTLNEELRCIQTSQKVHIEHLEEDLAALRNELSRAQSRTAAREQAASAARPTPGNRPPASRSPTPRRELTVASACLDSPRNLLNEEHTQSSASSRFHMSPDSAARKSDSHRREPGKWSPRPYNGTQNNSAALTPREETTGDDAGHDAGEMSCTSVSALSLLEFSQLEQQDREEFELSTDPAPEDTVARLRQCLPPLGCVPSLHITSSQITLTAQ